MEPDQAGRAPGRAPSDRGQHRDRARSPARGRDQLAGHQDLEGQPGPRVRRRRWTGSWTSTTRPPPAGPDGGRVICVDEFGPLNLQPRPGHGWFPRGRPARRRATYTRTGGVRHMFAALDLASRAAVLPVPRPQALAGVPRVPAPAPRAGSRPGGCTWCATTSPRTARAEVTDWCAAHDVELVFTPTNASWLNWIECRVHRAALLHPRRQRLPLPHRPGSRDRRLRPLGQPRATPNSASPSAPRSADPITYPTLLDAALDPLRRLRRGPSAAKRVRSRCWTAGSG